MPCTRKRASVEAARLLLEDADERLADALALGLGIGRRPRAARGSARRASTCTSGTWKWSPNVSHDLLGLVLAHAGRGRRRRTSAGRRSARYTSSAATAESTPPERPQITARRRPARGSARPARRSPRAPSTSPGAWQASVRKFLSMSVPRGVCCTSGWNCTRVEAALGILHRRDRRRGRRRGHAEARRARARRRRCGSSSRCRRRRRRRSSTPPSDRERRSCRTRRVPVRADLAAERLGHRLHAVADAEHRDPELEQPRVEPRRAVGS